MSEASEQSFETAIERLESILEEMESAQLPLETLINRYDEGVKLVKVCNRRLEEADKKIEVIAQKASGELHAEAFDPEAVREESEPPKSRRSPAKTKAPRERGEAISDEDPAESDNEVSLF